MSEREDQRLFEAWSQAAARSVPELAHARLRQRLLLEQAKARAPRRPALRYGLPLLAATVAVALVVLLWRSPDTTSFQVAGKSGQVGAWLTAETTRQLPLRFSEGTQVALGAGSRGRVSGVSSAGARIELEHGSVSANVTHRPGADWTFKAGPFEISVLGTELDVSWSPETGMLELTVSSGRVLLRGPLVPDAQEVRAGQRCRVDLTRRLLELDRLADAAAANPPVAAAPAAPAGSSKSQGEPGASAPEPNSSAGSPRATSPEALLELAAAARQTGRPEVERAALLECRRRAPGQPPAAQAAYLLGRASTGAEAARWFETYLREQPAGLLAREASGRLIESHVAAGNGTAAAQAAARYLAAYPNGPHASMARRTLSARSESQD